MKIKTKQKNKMKIKTKQKNKMKIKTKQKNKVLKKNTWKKQGAPEDYANLYVAKYGFNRHQISPMQSEWGFGDWRPGSPGSGVTPFFSGDPFFFCFFVLFFFLFFSRKKTKKKQKKNKKKKQEKNTAQKIRQTAPPKKTPPRKFHRLPPKKHWVGRPGQADSTLAVS